MMMPDPNYLLFKHKPEDDSYSDDIKNKIYSYRIGIPHASKIRKGVKVIWYKVIRGEYYFWGYGTVSDVQVNQKVYWDGRDAICNDLRPFKRKDGILGELGETLKRGHPGIKGKIRQEQFGYNHTHSINVINKEIYDEITSDSYNENAIVRKDTRDEITSDSYNENAIVRKEYVQQMPKKSCDLHSLTRFQKWSLFYMFNSHEENFHINELLLKCPDKEILTLEENCAEIEIDELEKEKYVKYIGTLADGSEMKLYKIHSNGILCMRQKALEIQDDWKENKIPNEIIEKQDPELKKAVGKDKFEFLSVLIECAIKNIGPVISLI
jgi:hypothetical protein